MFLNKFKKIDNFSIVVFLLSFFSGLLLFLILFNNYGQSAMVLPGDANYYFELSQNLNYFFTQDTLRGPVVILLFALGNFLFQSNLGAIIIQLLLKSTAAVLVYLLGRRFFSPKVGKIGALLFALEPYSLYFVSFYMSETILVFLLLLAVYSFVLYFDNNKYGWLILTFIILGLLSLTKPITLFLPLVFVVFFWLKGMRSKVKLLVGLLVFILVIFPWLLRNKLLFDTWQISSVPSHNLLFYNALPVYSEVNNINTAEAREEIVNQLDLDSNDLVNFDNAALYRDKGLDIILQHPRSYVVIHFKGMIKFLTSNGYRHLITDLSDQEISIPNKAEFLSSPGIIFNYLLNPTFLLLLFSNLFWAVIYLVIIIGSWYFIRRRYRLIWIYFLGILIFYFVFLTGPTHGDHYKISVMPFLFLLFALIFDLKLVKQKK